MRFDEVDAPEDLEMSGETVPETVLVSDDAPAQTEIEVCKRRFSRAHDDKAETWCD